MQTNYLTKLRYDEYSPFKLSESAEGWTCMVLGPEAKVVNMRSHDVLAPLRVGGVLVGTMAIEVKGSSLISKPGSKTVWRFHIKKNQLLHSDYLSLVLFDSQYSPLFIFLVPSRKIKVRKSQSQEIEIREKDFKKYLKWAIYIHPAIR
jgi:hypothetical protein